MRVVLRDNGSQRLGSATNFVEIPDIKKGRLALSGLMLGADQSQTSVATDLQEGQVDSKNLNLSPAVRIFAQGDSFGYAYEIFNAKTDRSKKTQLETQMRLFRDGQQVNAGTPTALSADQKNPQRLIGSGRVQLTRVPPGDYVLQVVVTDKLANEKNRIAAQSMDFEVR